MAYEDAATMSRAPSVDSSAPSTIQVAHVLDEDSFSERVAASTPPTSLAETNSSSGSVKGSVAPFQAPVTMPTVEEEQTGGRRTRRTRTSVNYNLVDLMNAQVVESANASRNVSGLTGRTLVSASDDTDEPIAGTSFGQKVEQAMDMDWEIPDELPPRPSSSALQRKPSVKDRVKKAAGRVGSVLGKRSHDMMEAGKRKVGEFKARNDKNSKYLKELDMGVKGVLDEMDFDSDEEDEKAQQARPAKKAKKEKASSSLKPMAPPLLKATSASGHVTARKGKRWMKEGLYVGQTMDNDRTKHGSKKKLQKNRPSSSGSQDTQTQPARNRTMLPLPMFGYLGDDKEVDFKIPFDVFAPSFKKGDPKPKDWVASKNTKNRIIGDAKEIWNHKSNLGQSLCICQPPADGELGCDENCLNRLMHYECNANNCMLNDSGCSNRPFAQLASRLKKGGPYDVGVEVIGTNNRGFGVRACRTFSPGEIIMEYTGEIITEYESERRMVEEYSKSANYYLMQFDRGLVIDGTKGSMGRFVNHSCAPNCEVRMMKGADGHAHMGIFAGDLGVMTGEELTYDYNFDNFGSSQQKCHCGTPSCRGFLSKRLNAAEQKLRDKEELERQHKAAIEAAKSAEAAVKAKKEKDSKGPGWTGWIDLNSKEVREALKREKQAKEEEAKNSERARRMAARRGEVVPPLPMAAEPTPKAAVESKKPARDTNRRQTTGTTTKTQKNTIRRVHSSESLSADAGAEVTKEESTAPKTKRFSGSISKSSRRSNSSGSATTTLLQRTLSADSDIDEDKAAVGILSRANGKFASIDATTGGDEEPETATIAASSSKTDKSKKRKLGNMLKDAASVVGIGRSSKRQPASSTVVAESSTSATRTPGKLKQSTLSFSKLL
jgi:histone-lysine N-methyltransferase ASH1L